MIKVTPINKKYRNGLVVEGHAGYAEHGEDIVCSAISVLTHMLMTQLPQYAHVKTTVNSGYTMIAFQTYNDQSEVLLKAFLETVEDLESQYPTYIKMEA